VGLGAGDGRRETQGEDFNRQKWIEGFVLGPTQDLSASLVIPLTEKTYLEATFTYAANEGVYPRDFRDAAMDKMELIQQSFRCNTP
jgi:hypothetical protein